MKITTVVLGAMLALPGCSLVDGASVTPAQIAAIENSLTAADQLAMAYMTLPVCTAPVTTKVCADPTVKATIKTDEQTAYTAFKALQSATLMGRSAALAAASSAVAVYFAAVPKVAVGSAS